LGEQRKIFEGHEGSGVMPTQEDIANLQDMFAPEELHADLVPYLSQGRLGQGLFHPLVHDPMYSEIKNKLTNRMYLQKTAAIQRAVEEGKWSSYIFLHERPYRLDALEKVLYEHNVDDPETVWSLIGSVWVDSENIHQNFDTWCDIWMINVDLRPDYVMDDDERAAFAALPEMIDIFRGVSHKDALEGLSWTTSREKAEWFAHRASRIQGGRPILASAKVHKTDVLAHFLGRNELEIVVMPEDLMELDSNNLRKKPVK
jgi:hypothetical protein